MSNLPTNTQLLQQIRDSKEFGIATVELAESMIKIIRRVCQKPGFERLMYVDEVEILRKMLYSMPRRVDGVTYTGTSAPPWQKFNEEYSNPFAFFIQCIRGHMINISHRKKKAMKELGLPRSKDWTPEEVTELEAAFANANAILDNLLVPLNVSKYVPLNVTEEISFEAVAPKELSELEKFQAIGRGLRKPNEDIRIVDYINILQPLKPAISEETYQACREIASNYHIRFK